MTVRHEIHCVKCGESKDKTGRVRSNSENEEEILIDCKKCGLLTTIIIPYDENANHTTIIEIENLKPVEYAVYWKKVYKNGYPIFLCPFCGDKNLEKIITKDGGENLFECKKCDRDFEIEYA